MIQLLNDEEIVEGLIGGLGTVIGVIYYKNSFIKSENIILISIIGWMIIWFTRKLLMRLYLNQMAVRTETKKSHF